jgi:hypothetical protein
MVYDWENKEEICYRMYIEEKKSLEEIMEYMKEEHKFAPRYVDIRTDVLHRTNCIYTITSSVLITLPLANVPSRRNSNAGISPPSRTPHTKMPPSSSASRSYGTATPPNGRCYASSTRRVSI